MEHVVSYRIKAIDDITPLQRRVNHLNDQSQIGFKKLGTKIDQVNAPARRLTSTLSHVGTQGVKASGSLMAGFGKLKNFIGGPMIAAVAGAFAVGKVVQFGSSVVSTLGKFERFEAVLTNTLGSNSAAKQVMDDIVKLAAKTPFEVDGLTDAWVRLANQGFRPSMSEMTKLGDLASSTGKDVSMLAEAVLDARVGENERLKEFGIQAQAHGNKVRFTFKGVTTEVDRNAQAIQNYLVGLGDLQGVQGAMAKISETTEGQVSNLSDKYTQLKLTIGKGLKPVIAGVIEFMGKLIDKFTVHAQWLLKNEEVVKRFTVNALSKLWKGIEMGGKLIGEMIAFWQKNGDAVKQYWGVISKILPPIIEFILKLGVVVMKAYSTFYTFILNVSKWFYDLGLRLGDFFTYLRDKYTEFKTWWEDNFFMAKWLTSLTDDIVPGMKTSWQGFIDWVVEATKFMLAPFEPLFKLVEFLDRKSQAHAQEKRRQASTDRLNLLGTREGLYMDQGRFAGTDPESPISNERANRWKLFGQTKEESPAVDIYGNPTTASTPGTGSSKTLSERATDVKGVVSGEIKHITINIQKLVETLMIKTEKLGMSESQVKTQMTRLLLSAVNDTQQSN